MPEEPNGPDRVDLTFRALEAANRHDAEAVASFFAPGAVFAGRALGDVFEGRAAIRDFVAEWFGDFTEIRYEVEEFVVLDGGLVLAVVSQVGRPAGVDGQVHQREGWALSWSPQGLIERLTVRGDIDEARDAIERLAEPREQT